MGDPDVLARSWASYSETFDLIAPEAGTRHKRQRLPLPSNKLERSTAGGSTLRAERYRPESIEQSDKEGNDEGCEMLRTELRDEARGGEDDEYNEGSDNEAVKTTF